MPCSKCLEDKEPFFGKFCIECFPYWWETNRKFLKSFGCITSGCPNKRRVSMGFCGTHAEEYWGLGGKVLNPRGKWFNSDGTRKSCSNAECSSPSVSQGFCRDHSPRFYIVDGKRVQTQYRVGSNFNKDGTRKRCSLPDCDRDSSTKGMCLRHYHRKIREDLRKGSPGFDICPVRLCERRKVATATVCKRCNQFRWRYSLTPEDVIEVWKEENYVCQNEDCLETKNLHFDHSHECCPSEKYGSSHKVSCGECNRGWLCRSCNLALGFLQENPRKIQGLLDYLQRFDNPTKLRRNSKGHPL